MTFPPSPSATAYLVWACAPPQLFFRLMYAGTRRQGKCSVREPGERTIVLCACEDLHALSGRRLSETVQDCLGSITKGDAISHNVLPAHA